MVKQRAIWLTFGILVIAAGWRTILLAMNAFPFNSDEAVVGLMARHITEGSFPIFFYGQAYMGSLDALLVALGFNLFGAQVWVIRAVQVCLYLGTIITTIVFGKIAFKSSTTGLLAGVLMVIPTVNVTLYSTVSLGGYGEAMLLGNLVLIIGVLIIDELTKGLPENSFPKKVCGLCFLWGCLAGLGLWANGLTLIYSLPMGIGLFAHLAKRRDKLAWQSVGGFFLITLLGFFLGSLPWWIFSIQYGITELVRELLGAAVAVEQGNWFQNIGNHLVNLVLLGLPAAIGIRPPWGVIWLGLPLIPIVLLFWAVITGYFFRCSFHKGMNHLMTFRVLGGMVLTLVIGFVFTSFGVDPSGRYFVPLAVPFALVAAEFFRNVVKRRLIITLVILCIAGHGVWGTLECAMANPPGITTQFNLETAVEMRYMDDLISFLHSKGENRGFTNYWVAYPLAFLSDEEIIFIPRLPYHNDLRYTARDDRYAPYQEIVRRSDHFAYITALTPNLDVVLRAELIKNGITWEEEVIGDFRVYYQLSRPITPGEMEIVAGAR